MNMTLENMVDSTGETLNIRGHIYEQISEKGSLKVLNFSAVIEYIFTHSTLITTLQCKE